MDYRFTQDQIAIKDLAERFTAAEITPNAATWDAEHFFPREAIKRAAALGFGAIYLDESLGGIGLKRIDAAIIFEAIAYGCPSTSAFISIHNMASWMIATFGGDAVRKKYLPELVSMENIASYALTEPDSGSDAAGLKAKAKRMSDHYLVNGSKAFISGAGENEVYVCMLRTGDQSHRGISCLVIDKDMPGVSFGAQERKLGWHSQPTATVIFEDVQVPLENLVGDEGQGFAIAMSGLDGGRLNIGACSIGGAQRCLDEAVDYVKQRKQFGQAIAEFQNTQFMLADMATELAASRTLLHVAAQKVDDDSADKTAFAAMAKLKATEAGSKIANDSLQLHGGYGYLMDYPVERFVRDLRAHEILEGTSQIMRMVIGRDLIS